jgi:formylglycine-generating enzyme required for sulfatase activity
MSAKFTGGDNAAQEPLGWRLGRPYSAAWRCVSVLLVLLASLLLAAETYLPNELRSASVWPSGVVGQGPGVVMAAADSKSTSDVEDFVQGYLDTSGLSVGTHLLPVRFTDRLGNVSGVYYLDVVIFDSKWQPGMVTTDANNNGLPDEWETQFFGALGVDPNADPDNDGLNNLQELNMGTDPAYATSPGNRIVWAEIFVDTDPGAGLGIPVPARDGNLDGPVEDLMLANFSTAALTAGNHTVGLRVQRETGEWSVVHSMDLVVFEDQTPLVPPAFGIIESEGFGEMLVAEGAGSNLSLAATTSAWDARDLAAGSTLGTVGEKPGNYLYYARFKCGHTGYGSPLAFTVVVQDPAVATPEEPLYVDSLLGIQDRFLLGTSLLSGQLSLRAPPWMDWSSLTGTSSGRYALLGYIGTGDAAAYGGGPQATLSLTKGGTVTWLWGTASSSVTQVNDKGMGTGKGAYPRFQNVTSEVPQYVYDSADSRWRCTGFTGTGSVPASGVGRTVTFFLDQDSFVTWLWVRQYRVAVSANHGTVDGWQEWYDSGTATALVPRANPGYVFDNWVGALSGATQPGVFSVSAATSVQLNFKPVDSVTLKVVEIDGSQSSASYSRGTVLDKVPAVLTSGTGNTRDAAVSWRIDGEEYKQGPGSAVTLALTRDTTLTWLPTRQYRLSPLVLPAGSGIVKIQGKQSTVDVDWYDAGPIRLSAQQTAGYRFVEWYFQQSKSPEVDVMLAGEMPQLLARFAKVQALGDFATIDGGTLTSPNSATVTSFRSFLPSAKMKRTLVTTTEYCNFLNDALAAGVIESPNFISVRGRHPLEDYAAGLKAEWFHGSDWTAAPDFRNVVTALSANFGAGSPASVAYGTPPCAFAETDLFCFRLRGQLYSSRVGTISLKEFCDDHIQIVFNGQTVLTDTNNASNAAVQVQAIAGWNDIEFIYTELSGTAKFQIQWDPNGGTVWQDIPSTSLRHRELSAVNAAAVSSYGVYDFYADKELVTLNAAYCNIQLQNAVYAPKSGLEAHPVVNVSWYGAMAYSRWLAEATGEPVTLPDEWLWEYAASGGNSTLTGKYYPWGPKFATPTHSYANYSGTVAGTPDTYDGTSPVGIFPMYQGLYDMAGNVFEWTNTLYEQGNPTDPYRVLRGGGWNQPADFLPSSNRQVYKNQYYSDQATGFRSAVVYASDFSVPGYVSVPVTPAVASANAGRADYAAPTDKYLLKATDVTNAEYAAFLTWAKAQGCCAFSSVSVQGVGVEWQDGKVWCNFTSDGGLQNVSGSPLPKQGWDNVPAGCITWHGAAAYCTYLGKINPGLTASLPTQWQWENAMLRGTALSSGSLDVKYDQTFWPGFYNLQSGVQEWTSSQPADGMTGRAVIRGNSAGQPAQYASVTKPDAHAAYEDSRSNLGFRPAITRIAPKIQYLPEKVVLVSSGTLRKVTLSADSLMTTPSWSWSGVSLPSWAALNDLGGGRCQITCTPPASTASGSLVVAVTDGVATTSVSIPYEVVSGGGFTITGLPTSLAMSQGDADQVMYVRATPNGTASQSVVWNLVGTPGWASIVPSGSLEARLTLSGSMAVSGTLTVQASSGGLTGSSACAVSVAPRGFRFINFPSSFEFAGNRKSVLIPLEATGGSPNVTPGWSVAASSSSWARIVFQNGLSAVLEVDRSGFAISANLDVTVSDGVASKTSTIALYEAQDAPRILLSQTNFSAVAGTPNARFLITGEDRNQADNLQWSLVNAPSWASIVSVGGRTAELVLGASAVQAATPFTLKISDGKDTATVQVTASVSNDAPVITGPSGLLTLGLLTGTQTYDFSVGEINVGQSGSLSVSGGGSWLNWWRTGNDSVRVAIDTSSSASGQFLVTASDSFSTASKTVSVSIADRNAPPFLGGLSPNLNLVRYATPVAIPLTLDDADAGDSLRVKLVVPVDGVRLEVNGARSAILRIDPTQPDAAFPIVLEFTDGKITTRSTMTVQLSDPAPDSFLIAAAEYFIDTEPAAELGIPIPSAINEMFTDCASFVRTIDVPATLSVGYHNIGVRVKTYGGVWSSTQWITFYVFDDLAPQGSAVARADGHTMYSKWNDVAGPSLTATTTPTGGTKFTDTNPSAQAGTTANLVFEDDDGVSDLNFAIIWAEYFVDSDPGQGSGMALPMDRRVLDDVVETVAYNLDTSALLEGSHTVGLRFRQLDGTWSQTVLMDFIVYIDKVLPIPSKKEIDSAEYVWNNTGSAGFGSGINLQTSLQYTDLGGVQNASIDTSPLDTGAQLLNLRFRDNDGYWGETLAWDITIDTPTSALSLLKLHIESNLGVPSLNYDTYQLTGGTISLNVPITYKLNNLVYANFGFVGQGSAPGAGLTNKVSFNINQASVVTWLWGRDCTVDSTSLYGSVTGNGNFAWYSDYFIGEGIYGPLETVQLSVPQSVPVSVGVRQYCTGWTGSGSAPVGGTTNSVTFATVAKMSQVDWLWQKQYQITVAVDGEGQVFGSDGWVNDGAVETLTAVPNEGFRFLRWEGDLNGSHVTQSMTVSAPKTVKAVFTKYRLWELDVTRTTRTLLDTYEAGANVSVSTASTKAAAPGSRYAVTGWQVVGGSAILSGAGTSTSFTVGGDAEVRWSGNLQHWITQRVNAGTLGSIQIQGSRTLSDGAWYDEGLVTLVATPASEAAFSKWVGDLDQAPRVVDVKLDGPLDAAAVFRSTNLTIIEMASLPKMTIAKSQNAGVSGFTPYLDPVYIAKYETTAKQYTDHLNAGLLEGSVYVINEQVFGRPELVPYLSGLDVTWQDAQSQLLSKLTLLDFTGSLSPPQAGTTASLQGQIFISKDMEGKSLVVSGNGSASLVLDGASSVVNQPLPCSLQIPAGQQWSNLIVTIKNPIGPFGIKVSGSGVDVPVSSGFLRYMPKTEEGYSTLLTGRNVGDDPNQLVAGATQLLVDTSFSTDRQFGEFWATESSGDLQLEATLTRQDAAAVSLMVRQSMRGDSPYLEVGIQPSGALLVTSVLSENTSVRSYTVPRAVRTSWKVRLTRQGSAMAVEFLENGKWMDVRNGNQDLTAWPSFSSESNPSLVGFRSSVGATFTDVKFRSLTPNYNYGGALLADMSWPGCTFCYDGAKFAPVTGKDLQPVNCVTYYGAALLAAWLQERYQDGAYGIPTEWQYEAALGAASGYKFPWPDGHNSAVYANLSGGTLANVGVYSPTGGLYDVAGNVWEWTSSPQWAEKGFWNNIRGGSYRQQTGMAQSDYRLFYGRKDWVSSEVGFRVSKGASVEIEPQGVISGNALTLDLSGMGTVRGAWSPQDPYGLELAPVSNNEFVSCLNDQMAKGLISVYGGWVYSGNPLANNGQKLLQISGNAGMALAGSLFTATQGQGLQPVTQVTAYGAEFFADWKTQQSATWSFRLPSEWEWQNLMTSGYLATYNSAAELNGGGSSLLASNRTNTWMYAGVGSGISNWTLSIPLGVSGVRVLKGAPLDQVTGDFTPSQRAYVLNAGEATSKTGFRLLVSPKNNSMATSVDGSITAVLDRSEIVEGQSATLTIIRRGDPVFAKTLTLVSGDARLSLPGTITFAAGQSSISAAVQSTANALPDRRSSYQLSIKDGSTQVVSLSGFILDPTTSAIQSIGVFNALSNRTLGDAPFTINIPSASSGLSVTVSVKSGPATISGGTVTLIGAGTVVLAANQSGNDTYAAASEVTTSFVVAQGSQSIGAFPAIAAKAYGIAPFGVIAPVASSGLPVSVTVKSGPATISGGSVSLTGLGTVVFGANQAGNVNYTAATEVTTSFAVTQGSQSIGAFAAIGAKAYGSAPFGVTAPVASSGLPVTVAVKSGPATIVGGSVTVTGLGTVVLAVNQAGNVNYAAATEVTTSFAVTQGSQSIGAFAAIGAKAYGSAPFGVIAPVASSGLPVSVTVKSGPATISGGSVSVNGVGTVVLAANQAGNTNYTAAAEVTTSFAVTQATQSLYVSISGSDSTGNGLQATPFATLQKAVDAAVDGGSVLVLPGTYTGVGNRAVNLRGKKITLRSSEGASRTVLDLGRNQAFLAYGTESENTVIDGFTVINGYSSSGQDWGGNGIVDVREAGLSLKNCVFRNNEAVVTYLTTSAGIIAKTGGAGTRVVVDNCLFYQNTVTGGKWGNVGLASVICYLGVNSTIDITRCTIANNTLNSNGTVGGIVIRTAGKIENTIVWNNGPVVPSAITAPGVSYTICDGVMSDFNGAAITGALNGNPLFVNASTGDYSLGIGSPARDTGNPATALDADGSRADIGWRASGLAVITAQPVGAVVNPGAPVSLSVNATGSGVLSYQWKKGGINLIGGTGATYAIGSAAESNEGEYTVVVSNDAGTVTSTAATVSVNDPVVITAQPTSLTVNAGSLASFSVTATGTAPFSYQWRKAGTNIAGGTSATYTIASAQTTDAGSYSVVVSNVTGSVASGSASLIVNKASPVIFNAPTASAIAAGQALSSSVLSGGSASVAGIFAFTSPSSVPSVGTSSQSVTFTPTDVTRYNAVSTSVSVSVNPLVSLPGITSGTIASGTVGAVFNYQISATNNPTSYSVTGLTSGLTVNASTGLISGTPTTAGQTTVTLRATNSAGTGTSTLTLNLTQSLVQGVPAITSGTSAGGIIGGPFTYQTMATNNPTSFNATGLPAGLSVNTSTGLISGTLNAAGQFPITLTATNSTGVGSATLALAVSLGTLNWSDLAGTYEGLLEQSPDSQVDDGAAYRGAFSLTFSRTGSVSGRVFYNEATALEGSQNRVYVPVTRTFGGMFSRMFGGGMLAANSANPLAYQKVVRLGTGKSLGRQELTLEVSFAETPPRLNVTVKDTASPSAGEDAWVSQALSCSRSLTKLPASTSAGGGTLEYSKAVGRYTLSATDGDPSGVNSAHVLVQLLSTGKLLWTSRMKGTFGTGSTGLRVTTDGLNASVYEGRVSSTSASIKSTSLLGSLNFVWDSTSGSWSSNFGSDTLSGKLEKQASYVSKTGGRLVFNGAQDSTGVTELDFSNQDGARWGNTTVTTVPAFLMGGTSTSFPFTLNAEDPPDSDGNTASYVWNVSVSQAGRVVTKSTTDGTSVLSPRLLLTLNRQNGEFTGYYMTNISGKNVRRNIYGCGLTSQTDEALRARGWVESGVLPTLSTGGWTLKLGQ